MTRLVPVSRVLTPSEALGNFDFFPFSSKKIHRQVKKREKAKLPNKLLLSMLMKFDEQHRKTEKHKIWMKQYVKMKTETYGK